MEGVRKNTELTVHATTWEGKCCAVGVSYSSQVTQVGKCLFWPALDTQVTLYLCNAREDFKKRGAGVGELGAGGKVKKCILRICMSTYLRFVTSPM